MKCIAVLIVDSTIEVVNEQLRVGVVYVKCCAPNAQWMCQVPTVQKMK
jgi:hypothetical protein